MVEEEYKCPVCLVDADAYGDHQVDYGGMAIESTVTGRTLLGCPDRSAHAPKGGPIIDP